MNRGLAVLLVAVALSSGCVTGALRKNFASVEHEVAARTGYEVAWAGVTSAQGDMTAYVAELLDQPLTADSAVQVALLNNRELQATFAEMGIEVAEFVQAGLLPNPVAEAAFKMRGGRTEIEGGAALDFLQVFLIPLRRRMQGMQLAAARSRVAAEVIDLAADTRIAFYDYAAAKQELALTRDLSAAASAAHDMATQLRAAGNIPLLVLHRNRIDFERGKLDVAEAEMRAADARERLNRLLGLWGAGTAWESDARIPPAPYEEIDLEGIESRAVQASLDLDIAWYNAAATARRLGIRRLTSLLPQLELGVDAERELERQLELVKREFDGETEYRLREADTERKWWVGPSVQIEIPLFDHGQGRRAAARMEARRRLELFSALAIEVRAAARRAAYRLEYARARAQFLEQVVVPVQHEITLQSHLEYNAMAQGVFSLLQTKQRELETSRQYLEALRDYWEVRTQTEQLLMGRLYDRRGVPGINERGRGGPQRMDRRGRAAGDRREGRGEGAREGGH